MKRFVPTYQGKPFLSIEAAERIVFLRIMVVIITHDKEEKSGLGMGHV